MILTRRGVTALLSLLAVMIPAVSGCGPAEQQPGGESAGGGGTEEEAPPEVPSGPPGSISAVITYGGEAAGSKEPSGAGVGSGPTPPPNTDDRQRGPMMRSFSGPRTGAFRPRYPQGCEDRPDEC